MSFETLIDRRPAILTEAAREFWDGIDREELVLPRCSICHKWSWYPDPAGCCKSDSLKWTVRPGTGSIFTFTRVHFDFLPDVLGAQPYNVALVELDGTEGIRFVGLLSFDDPVIGQRVRIEFVDRPYGKFPLFVQD